MIPRDALLAQVAALRAQADALAALADDDAHAQVEIDPLVSCEQMGIPRKTWLRACRSGQLRAVRVGREYMARRSDIDAWFESLPTAATAPAEPEQAPAEPDDALDRALARGRLRAVGRR